MRVYFCALICVGVGAFYFIGRAAGTAECRAQIAAQNADAVAAAHTVIIEKERKIDAETYRMGAGDIRRVLREKYTIAE